MVGAALLIIAVFAGLAYIAGRTRGRRFQADAGHKLHSLPGYHGVFVALWVGVPALILVLSWGAMQGAILDRMVEKTLAEQLPGTSAGEIAFMVSEVKNLVAGRILTEASPAVVATAERLNAWSSIAAWAMLVTAAAMMIIALLAATRLLAPRFRARNQVERILSGLMITCSVIAILTTLGIIVSLLYEASAFFRMVPVHEFLFGLKWEPQIALRPDQVAGAGAFGAIPVFTGTLLISAIALLVAVPTGLFTAIYLVEYASHRLRATVKPVLEILAGIPTVVFGFFAILIVAPAVREIATGVMGLPASSNSALAAGIVMGIMLIPFISSLSDDALRAVPRALRDGSLALGATPAETITKVVLRAALPGIMGGILLAASRAIGETMIVAMAAGLIASLTLNPLESVTTVTVQIVTLLTGDSEFDSPKTLAAFGLGLALFLVTLALNVIALRIVRKYREHYE